MPAPDSPADLSRQHASAKAAVVHAIHLLDGLLAKRRYSVRLGGPTYDQLRQHLPYVVHDTALPNTQILVNRRYKPVGSNVPSSGPQVAYEHFVNLQLKLSPAQIRGVVSPPHLRGLYGDDNPPWASRANALAYRARLVALQALLP